MALSANTFAPHRGTDIFKNSAAWEKSNILKASHGHLVGLMVSNSGASDCWIQIFDSATLPADATVPSTAPFMVKAGTTEKLDIDPTGWEFSTGIVVCGSSTQTTKTLIASNDLFFTAVVM